MQGDLEDYQTHFHTGKIMGGPILNLLDAKPGMRVLDLGCGDGLLTQQIADAGADVVGVDCDPAFVAAAKDRNLTVHICDGHHLDFSEEFDRVFSNAALHWMVADPVAVLRGVYRALRPGGLFVAEFGGKGNVAAIVAALSDELRSQGVDPEECNPWFFPSAEEYAGRLRQVGFEVNLCEFIDCPKQLDGDLIGWLRTFCAKWLCNLDAESASALLRKVRDALKPQLFNNGKWVVEYKRIRLVATKSKGAQVAVGDDEIEPHQKRVRRDAPR